MLEARRECNKALPVAAPPAPSLSCLCLPRWTLEAFSLISVSLPLNTELARPGPYNGVDPLVSQGRNTTGTSVRRTER